MAALNLPKSSIEAARNLNFDLQGYSFAAAKEQLRSSRKVRIALLQNKIVLPTTAPFVDQRNAILERVKELAAVAAECGANILCLQEAFHMPFAFCTREKEWCEFAEPVIGGHCVQTCQEIAEKYNMVIVCPILERDTEHLETVWNTAVVISNKGGIIGKHRKVTLLWDLKINCNYFKSDRCKVSHFFVSTAESYSTCRRFQ